MSKTQLNGLSAILTYFRKNETPIYFVSPTPFNLLGVEKFVNHFYHINYFDCFDRLHPRVFVPQDVPTREFQSMEEVCNTLLVDKEVSERIGQTKEGPAQLLFVMFDEETEALAKKLRAKIALPSAELRKRLDSKIETTRLANEAGIQSAPNVLGEASTYEQLRELADANKLGSKLVVQTPYGDSGRTTFFISSEADWNKHANDIIDEQLKVMKYINHMPGTLEACVTRHGTLVGPVQTDITGYEQVTPYQGGWCGNDINPRVFSKEVRDGLIEMAQKLGNRLYQEGYKGVFCMDFLIDTDDGTPYLGEINPRISGASTLTNLICSHYGGAPLFLFHLLEHLDIDYVVDLQKIQRRWNSFDFWSQLILKQTQDKVQRLTKAPRTGIYHMDKNACIHFQRNELDWTNVIDDDEAFYMRVYKEGDYTYKGADLGIVVARGRFQTNDRRLRKRARQWTAAINAEFEGVKLEEAPIIPTGPLSTKFV